MSYITQINQNVKRKLHFASYLYIITQDEVIKLSMAKKIKMILLERGMTIRQLSEKMGYEGSYLYNKLNRDRMTEEELREIADALDCDYDGIFTFRDSGKTI